MGKHPPATEHGRSAGMSARILGLAFCLVAQLSSAQAPGPLTREIAERLNVLDRFRGTWDVTLKTQQPKPSVVTFTETYAWVLERRFLHGDSGRKSDGTQDVVWGTYDEANGGYPFWIFSSTGAWIYLAPGTWDAASRTMTWKNPPNSPVSYLTRCVFPDANTRRWTVLVKDWKGKVLLEQEGSAVRKP